MPIRTSTSPLVAPLGGPSASSGHLPGLDGLRGLAVAAVVAFHLGASWLPGGFLGVSVFFTLSGFLITRLLVAEHARTGRIDLRAFWGRRVRRLLPAAWATLLVIALVVALAPDAKWAVRPGDGDLVASLVNIANWHFLGAGASYSDLFRAPSPVLHFWSLAIEEQLYLVVPVALWLLLRRWGPVRALQVVVVGATASFLLPILFGLSLDRTYYGTDTRAGELLAGAALALAWTRPWGPARAVFLSRLGIPAGLAMAVLMVGIDRSSTALTNGLLAGVAIVSCVLLVGAAQDDTVVARALALRPLQHLGRISYGVYLVHWPLIVAVATFDRLDRAWSITIVIASTLVVAEVSNRWLERPVRDRRVPQRAFVAGVVATAALVVVGATVVAPDPTRAEELLASLESAASSLPNAPPMLDAVDQAPPVTDG